MEIFIFDDIIPGMAQQIRGQLETNPTEKAELHINSAGGLISEGIAIASLIRSHEGPVDCTINGLCASMATIIALSSDSVAMVDGSLFMIHEARFPNGGTAEEMRRKADISESLTKSMVNVYQAKTRLGKKAITQLMKEETVLTANEALKMGFIDSVIQLQAVARFDLNNINDMNIKEQIRNLGKSLGAIPNEDETDKAVKDIQQNAELKAEGEVTDKIKESESPAEGLTAELVKNVDFLAFRDQTLEFMQKVAEFIDAQPTDEQTAEALRVEAENCVKQTLQEIKVKAQVPVKTGSPILQDIKPFENSKAENQASDFRAIISKKLKKSE